MEKLKTYLIEYIVYGKTNEILKEGTVKAKNKESEFDAKAGFGKHIEEKYADQFGHLYIKSCKLEFDLNNIFTSSQKNKGTNDIFSQFGDIFGGGFKKK